MVYYLIGVYGEKLMIISGDYACPVKNGTRLSFLSVYPWDGRSRPTKEGLLGRSLFP